MIFKLKMKKAENLILYSKVVTNKVFFKLQG